MGNHLTNEDVVTRLRNLLYSDAVYMWGANGETITPELIQRLKERFVSDRHTPDYYDEKLNGFRGKKAVDDIGMLNFLSGENLSFYEYLSRAVKYIPAVDISANQVWILCRTKISGNIGIGIYLGNGNVMVCSEGLGLEETPINLRAWNMAFLPDFINAVSIPDLASAIIVQYQNWINTEACSRGIGTISVTGYYDTPTKNLSRLMAKVLYGNMIGTSFDVTAEITMREIISRIGIPRSLNLSGGYNTSQDSGDTVELVEKLFYIISMRLYSLDLFPEFTAIWGNTSVRFTEEYGTRRCAVLNRINTFMRHSRYLDSNVIDLSLLRELFL